MDEYGRPSGDYTLPLYYLSVLYVADVWSRGVRIVV
jgi:hypothetical protein